MNYKNYYDILGVPKGSAEKDIKSAYRKLARKWHPDANLDNARAAEEKFKDVQEAYEVLGDAEKRRKYDVLGNDWQRAAQQAEQQRSYRRQQASAFDFGSASNTMGGAADAGAASGFSDFFEAFFGGMGGGRRTAPPPSSAQRGTDLETTIDVALSDAYSGASKSISLQIEDLCPRCHGTGTERNRICPQCHGTGRILQTKRFDVTIPRGISDGQRIRLAGQGGAGVGGARGDLLLVVRLVDDASYQRKGDDLYLDLPVSIYDLVLGGEVAVPTMGGPVTMTVPAGTQNNKMLRLTGKGMPRIKGGGAGDQYVRLQGMLPQHLSDKEVKLFRELAAQRNGKA